MTRTRSLALALTLVTALPLFAAKSSGALSLVPTNAASVGMVKLGELRSSPLSGTLFDQADRMGGNGDAERFLLEAGLSPTKDVDVLVVAMIPKSNLGTEADALVIAEGRFNVERLSAAIATRGAVKKGSYFVVEHKGVDSNDTAAVAFLSSSITVAGSEKAVADAVGAYANGGTSFLGAGALGGDLRRFPANASGWILIDVPRASRLTGTANMPTGKDQSTQALAAAMKTLGTVGIWGTDAGDQLKLGGFGVSSDGETLQLLEDTIRGALAAMRLAVKDKAPELIPVLRAFNVSRTSDTVVVNGSIPAETIRKFATKKSATTTASR